MLNAVIQKLLAIRFDDPKVDEAAIRYHASLSGKYELLLGMIQDNYEAPEPQGE